MRTNELQQALDRLSEREGGYVFDPKDPGGETKFGISKRSYPDLDIKNLTKAEAADIYERDFWLATGIALLGLPLAEAVLDFAVNAGPGAAIRAVQRAVGVPTDGVLGPRTRGAVLGTPEGQFARALLLERLLFYVRTILARPTSLKYARGWFNRALDVA